MFGLLKCLKLLKFRFCQHITLNTFWFRKERKCLLWRFCAIVMWNENVGGPWIHFDVVEYFSMQIGSTFIIKTSDSCSPTLHRTKNKNKYHVHSYAEISLSRMSTRLNCLNMWMVYGIFLNNFHTIRAIFKLFEFPMCVI